MVQPNQKFRGQVILDKPISKTEVITLPYNFNQITFEFTTMHYAASKKNTFEYILEGVDKNLSGYMRGQAIVCLIMAGVYSLLFLIAGLDFGLLIGILSFIGYNLLVSNVQKVVFKMEALSMEFIDLLEEPA